MSGAEYHRLVIRTSAAAICSFNGASPVSWRRHLWCNAGHDVLIAILTLLFAIVTRICAGCVPSSWSRCLSGDHTSEVITALCATDWTVLSLDKSLSWVTALITIGVHGPIHSFQSIFLISWKSSSNVLTDCFSCNINHAFEAVLNHILRWATWSSGASIYTPVSNWW